MQSVLAIVDLGRIRKNARLIARRAGVPLYAVVKDNAYGHGAERVSLALEELISGFAVATVTEGAALRIAGIQKEILVLTPPLIREEALRISAYHLTASLNSLHTLHLLKGLPVEAHLCVDTGMNRYGVRPARAASLSRAALEEGIRVTGVYSHLYAPENDGALFLQEGRFFEACEGVRRYFPHAVRHLSATGGTLRGATCDAVRAGIALYGYLPEGFEGLPVKPALKLYAAVAQSKLFTGGGVGYAPAQREYGALTTLRVGYGDGLFRTGGVGIGNLCMDAAVCEGGGRAGTRRRILPDLAAYARLHHTSVYEILVRITSRAEFVYING